MTKGEESTPSPQSINVPDKFAPLIEVFPIQTEEAARHLLEEAARAIYYEKNDPYDFEHRRREVKQEEVEMVYSLLRDIKPENTLEVLLGIQIVIGHLLGVRKLTLGGHADIKIGLKLISSSANSIERLHRLRNGCSQNISVIYHNNGPAMQAVITKDQSNAQ